jgi:osomolarity two-component system sensor histidine kinase SLN1
MCGTITTRLLIQEALWQFYNGNDTSANWTVATSDIEAGLDSFGYITLLQAIIFPREQVGNIHGLLNATRSSMSPVALPYNYPNGSVSVAYINSSVWKL